VGCAGLVCAANWICRLTSPDLAFARRAHATAVSISLTRRDELITLGITDNGRGLGTPARSSGLSSMRYRAERHGGTFALTTLADGGTRLTWTASVHPSVQEKI
jgi:glucose-6-phosphate-specific signal transduction histidine kinase